MRNFRLFFFVTLLFGCTSSGNSRDSEVAAPDVPENSLPAQPLQIDAGEDEGWGGDIRLSVVEQSENDTVHIYKALSTYQGKELGLLVTIPKRKEGSKGFGQGITFASIGASSDYLLQILAKLYKQPIDSTATFIKDIQVNYVNLQAFAESVSGQEGSGDYTVASEYKLFFEGSGEEDYAELYLNIDPLHHWIELREKDEEYRPVLLRLLRQ